MIPGIVASSVATASSFNPLTALTWHTAAWAEDAAWTNPGDGNAVSSWRDGSGNSRTLTQGTAWKQPLYRASVAALNGKPGLEHDGTDDSLITATFTGLTTPWSIVAVLKINNVVNNTYLVSGNSTGLRQITGPNRFSLYNGSVFDSTLTADLVGHFVHAVGNGASSKLGRDGVEQTGNAGAADLTKLNTGSFGDSSSWAAVTIAFAGVYAGNVTAAGGWAAFKAGMATHYGLTIA